jgi:hypothetical protein
VLRTIGVLLLISGTISHQIKKILWEKIRERYFDWMNNRDLHFLLGTHSIYPVWMIIGLYYPPM